MKARFRAVCALLPSPCCSVRGGAVSIEINEQKKLMARNVYMSSFMNTWRTFIISYVSASQSTISSNISPIYNQVSHFISTHSRELLEENKMSPFRHQESLYGINNPLKKTKLRKSSHTADPTHRHPQCHIYGPRRCELFHT